MERVAVVRAVGVVFSETGTDEQRAQVKPWLRALLHDPAEKVRRYAMAALPKLGAGPEDEAALLALWRSTTSEREKTALAETLEKIGGAATLREITSGAAGQFAQAEQKVKASVARSERPSVVRMDRALTEFAGLRIYLRGRSGLEAIVRDEVEEHIKAHGKFRVCGVRRGLVEIEPVAPFRLGDLYSLRCFGTVSFVLGSVENADEEASSVEMLAQAITSPTLATAAGDLHGGLGPRIASISWQRDISGRGAAGGKSRVRLVPGDSERRTQCALDDRHSPDRAREHSGAFPTAIARSALRLSAAGRARRFPPSTGGLHGADRRAARWRDRVGSRSAAPDWS